MSCSNGCDTPGFNPPSGGDEKVKVSAGDTTPDFLQPKIVAGANITITKLNAGGNEQLQIASAGGVLDHKVAASGTDTTPDFLFPKLAVTAALALSLLNGGGNEQVQIDINAVSNATKGAAPAITAGTAALVSNGGGTAAAWTAISGGGSPVGTNRTISTTAPLSGGGDLSANRTLSVATASNVSSGVVPQITAANTFLKSADGINLTWAALFTPPANPGDTGKLVKANAGDFVYIGGSATGQVATWNQGTTSFSVTDPNFGALDVTTTGRFVNNTATPILRMGLAPGSGAGSAANSGQIRGPRDFSAFVIANDNATDVQFWLWSSSTAAMTFGSSGMNLVYNVGTSHSFQVAGSGKVSITATNLNMFVPTIQWSSGNAPSLQVQAGGAGTSAFSITGQATSGTNNSAGDINLTGGACTAGGAVTSQTGGSVWSIGGLVSGSSGTRVHGSAGLKAPNGTKVVEVSQTLGAALQIAFFNAALAAKATLTQIPGGVDANALVDVTTAGLADPVKVNANFAAIWAKFNTYGLWS